MPLLAGWADSARLLCATLPVVKTDPKPHTLNQSACCVTMLPPRPSFASAF